MQGYLHSGACAVIAAVAVSLLQAQPVQAARKPPAGFEAALPLPPPPDLPPDGAIFNAGTGYAGLVEGHRARAVGDPLTVQLVEQMTTSKSAGSKTQRQGGFNLIPPATGPLGFLNPDALNGSGGSSFNGQGNASQTSSLAGEVSVTIAQVRPNGTALIRGEKRLLLSQGHEWVQFSGIVRLADIGPDNRILSTRVADARIEYAGNGSIQRAGKAGWLQRFFNTISPF